MPEDIPALVVFGIVDAAVLAIAAVGFTLQFGVTNYFNFGYGEWLTFGAFIAMVLNGEPLRLNIWVAMVFAGLATVCGLDAARLSDVTWLMTGFMAGVAGVILAMQVHTFGTDVGNNFTYLIFPAVIIGGIGRAYGAMVGALIIGLLTALGVLVIPAALTPTLIFGAIVLMVLFRPQGLLGGIGHARMQEG